jgi:hypothetical protein
LCSQNPPCFLSRNKGSLSEGENVEDDVTPDAQKHNIKESLLSGNCFSLFSKLSEKVNYQGRLLLTEEFVGEFREKIDDALEHLAGFICHQIVV